jgi:CubicO group peptidase (beta-lactamase class C family)
VPDAQVASGRIPGYVAAVRVGWQVEVRAGGRTAAEAESAPMGEDTLFRIASVTKPMGGVWGKETRFLREGRVGGRRGTGSD